MLFHDKALAVPELWRKAGGQPEGKQIAWSTLFGAVASAMVIAVCHETGAHNWMSALDRAFFLTLLGPLPLVANNVIWTKLPASVGAAHTLGWFVRFLISALLAVWLM